MEGLVWGAAFALSFWLLARRRVPKKRRNGSGIPDAHVTDVDDPHWYQAHVDEFTAIERQVAFELPSGRTVYADVMRMCPRKTTSSEKTQVFVFFCGNPGLVDFYTVFLRQVFDRLDGKVLCAAVGHAGHSPWSHGGPIDQSISFEEQLQHKVCFLKQEFPQLFSDTNWQVTLAGHSVGARCGLEVMHRLHGQIQVRQYFGLCPTVMSIAKSPNGVKNTPLLDSFVVRSTAVSFAWLLSLLLSVLPRSVAHKLGKKVMRNDNPNVDDYYVQHGLKLVDPWIIRNVLAMANEEMKTILDHRDDVIQHALVHHMDQITFVCSPIDKWCCSNIIKDMRKAFKTSNFVMLPDDVTHAFCLTHSNVAQVVDAMTL